MRDASKARSQTAETKSAGRLVKLAAVALGVVIVLGGAAGAWLALGGGLGRTAYYTDADTIRAPVRQVDPRDILWQPPQKLPEGIINSAADDYEPRLSWDGMTLFFVRGKAGENADIYVAQRLPNGWTEPVPLSGVNSNHDDLGPELSGDGALLYFYSDRPDGVGGYDIWVARKGAGGWDDAGGAINLGPLVNSEFNDYGPAVTSDGGMLYFASNRPQPGDEDGPAPDAWPATIREDLYFRDYDLYAAPITDRGGGLAAPLAALNTPFNDGSPAVSPVGDFLYFASDRPGGRGGFDLYRSRRLQGAHEPPINLGEGVNTAANELDPGLGLGGFGLHFSSDRPLERLVAERPNDYNVYYMSSREIFTEYEEIERPPFDWAALWSRIGPNLLWALLALLLLLLLLTVLGDLRRRRLSLLARCLLASLMLHLLLMLLLNSWNVTTEIGDFLRRRGKIQVALTSSSVGDALVTQIRGNLTDVQAPTPIEVASERPAAELEVRPEHAIAALAVDSVRDVSANELDIDDAIADASVDPTIPGPQSRPIALDRATRATNADLPTEVARVSESEPDVAATAAPLVMPDAARARTPADQPPPSVNVTEVLAPLPSTVLPETTAESLVMATPPTDRMPPLAVPSAASTRSSAALPTVAGMVDVNVPGLEVASAAALEASPTLSPADPQPTRSAAELPATPTPDYAIREIKPDDRPATAADLSLVFTAAAVDSLPAVRLVGALTPALDASMSGAAMANVALPEMEALPASALGDHPADEPRPDLVSVHGDVTRAGPAAVGDWANLPMPMELHSAVARANRSRPDVDRSLMQGALDAPAISAIDRLIPLASSTNFAPSGDPLAADRLAMLTTPHLRLPTEIEPPEDPYAQRSPEQRQEVVEQLGGGRETERAVAQALNWFARHQSDDGRWDGRRFDRDCGECGGSASVDVDRALTGLALLCFLAADNTHAADGPYRDSVQRGLTFLLQGQDDDGDLRRGETMYTHGIVTIALSEAFGMTKDPALAGPVQRAVRFIEGARNQSVGGWRYDPGQPGDTSVLGWQIMAIKSARLTGVDVSQETFDAAADWLERVSKPGRPGLYAYQPGRRATPPMTAEGMFVQQLLGRTPDDPIMQASAEFIAEDLPDWHAHPNTYYWYYATLALFQHQGEQWRAWNGALTEALLPQQHDDGPRAGSWDPVGEWGPTGGRIYQTALCTLMLEVYYRYLPLYVTEQG